MAGVPQSEAAEAMRLAGHKLPVDVKFLVREGVSAMDIAKVRDLTDTELCTELATQRRHLYDLRFQLATRQLTDFTQIAQTRRSIARLLTVLTERDDERPRQGAAADATATPSSRAATR